MSGVQLALDLASTFQRFETLTHLVYQGGYTYYQYLYNHIDNGNYQLKEAIQVAYRCDRRHLREAVQKNGFQTFNKDYNGF